MHSCDFNQFCKESKVHQNNVRYGVQERIKKLFNLILFDLSVLLGKLIGNDKKALFFIDDLFDFCPHMPCDAIAIDNSDLTNISLTLNHSVSFLFQKQQYGCCSRVVDFNSSGDF